MRIKLSQWDSLSPAQRAAVTHIEIDDCEKPWSASNLPEPCPRSYSYHFSSEFEEYPGEAESRGVDQRGFNKP